MQPLGSTKTRPTHTTQTRTRRLRVADPKFARRGAEAHTPTPPPAAAPATALSGGRATAAERGEIDRMSREERLAAMQQGRLSLRQLTYWSSRYGDEVPLIGGEFAYIAMRDPEYCEPASPNTVAAGVES